MNSKTFILSSSGLKNLITGKLDNDPFQFIFGQHTISMNNIFAEFISPKVSNIHKSDPTINFIMFDNLYDNVMINESTFLKFQYIACGETIDLNEKEIFEMKVISILVENEELFCKLNDLYPIDINESNINQHLTNFAILTKVSPSISFFNILNTINIIANYFYAADLKLLKKFPKSVIYSIICNSNLQIVSEDSLFDFINEIFTNENDDDNDDDDIVSFYE